MSSSPPPPPPPQPLPPPPPGYAYAPIASQDTNGFAIAALVLGILGGGILAVIFGHVALGQIKTRGEQGHGMAVAGLVLGYVTLAFWLILLVVMFAAFSSASGSANGF